MKTDSCRELGCAQHRRFCTVIEDRVVDAGRLADFSQHGLRYDERTGNDLMPFLASTGLAEIFDIPAVVDKNSPAISWTHNADDAGHAIIESEFQVTEDEFPSDPAAHFGRQARIHRKTPQKRDRDCLFL